MISAYETKSMKENTITLVNKSDVILNGVKPGSTIMVKADKDGVPLDRYWRNRLRDAGMDGAVEVVKSVTTKKKADS